MFTFTLNRPLFNPNVIQKVARYVQGFCNKAIAWKWSGCANRLTRATIHALGIMSAVRALEKERRIPVLLIVC